MTQSLNPSISQSLNDSTPQSLCYNHLRPGWRYRLGVRTEDSQSSNPGPIPGRATNPSFCWLFVSTPLKSKEVNSLSVRYRRRCARIRVHGGTCSCNGGRFDAADRTHLIG